jgi:pimeloyl-ACP methyl ester carboxylesterase
LIRQSASPGAAAALVQMNGQIDVRSALSAIRVPTLVLNRTGDGANIVGGSRYLAEKIPGARHVEVSGVDHSISAGTPIRSWTRSNAF